MGQFVVKISEKAQKDLAKHKKAGDLATNKRILKILNELKEHPKTGTGQPEQLKYDLTGYWSRRLNSKDRMVYQILEEIVVVEVVSAMGHYSDK